MKDNTVDKKILSGKTPKWIIVQMFSDHKKQRNEEKHFIKSHKTLFTMIFKKTLCLLLQNRQTDRQNIHRIVAYIWEECL